MRKAAVGLLVVATGVLLDYAIPPFQNPDEPLHLAMILRFAHGEARAETDENEIVRLLDRFDWYRFVGMRRPEAAPASLEEVPFLTGNYGVEDYGVLLHNVVVYHFAMAKIVRLFGGGSVLKIYYLVRLASFLLFGAALVLAFRTFRRFSNHLAHGFLFVVFLPQLAINSIAASPDAAILCLGSLFFWAAFALIGGKAKAKAAPAYFAALCLAAAAAVVLDKSAFLLLPLGALAFVFYMTRKNYQDVIVWMLLLSIVFILSIYFLSLAFPLKMESAVLLLKGTIVRAKASIGSVFAFDALNRRFFSRFIDSFFLRFGWRAFGAGRAVDWIWRVLVLGTGIGVGVRGVRLLWRKFVDRVKQINAELAAENAEAVAKTKTEAIKIKAIAGDQEGSGARMGRIVLFSLVAIVLQVVAIRLAAAPEIIYAQGRYLFPFIIPVALVFVLGIKNFFDLFARRGTLVLRIVLVLMFVFFNGVVWGLMIPVFHLTAKSPFPGI